MRLEIVMYAITYNNDLISAIAETGRCFLEQKIKKMKKNGSRPKEEKVG